MSQRQTPSERVAAMSEGEKIRLLRRVADDVDDEAVARICELAAHSKEERIS